MNEEVQQLVLPKFPKNCIDQPKEVARLIKFLAFCIFIPLREDKKMGKVNKTAFIVCISFILIITTMVLLVRLSDNKQVDYLALGDSIAAGVSPFDSNKTIKSYPDFIAETLKKQGILGEYEKRYAIKGHTTFDLLKDIQNDILVDTLDNKDRIGIRKNITHADIITLDIGANDILKKINYASQKSIENNNITSIISQTTINLNQIIIEIHKLNSKVKIYLMGYYNMLPLLSDPEKMRFLIDLESLNQTLEQVATDDGAVYVPTDMIFTDQNYHAFLPVAFNVHLNENGNKELSNLFLKVMDITS
jgi:lysophospholipase L1-like esterase